MTKVTVKTARRAYRTVKPYLPGPTFDTFYNVFYYSFKFTLEMISLALTIWSALLPSS
jgi:hypothetical protein